MDLYEMRMHAGMQIHPSTRNSTGKKIKTSAKCASANIRFEGEKNFPVHLQKLSLSKKIFLSAPMITTETKESNIQGKKYTLVFGVLHNVFIIAFLFFSTDVNFKSQKISLQRFSSSVVSTWHIVSIFWISNSLFPYRSHHLLMSD